MFYPRKAYMDVLRCFHKADFLIENVKNDHILMDGCDKVTVISLSNISTNSPKNAEKSYKL